MYTFTYYFLIFIIYAILGWIMETCLCSISQKKLVNRGFLIGPYCPIYGWGCLAIIFLLKPYTKDPLVLICMTIIICSILEYFTSWIMEKIFHARWWDYSNKKYNIEGRICLKNSIFFGIGGVLVLLIIQPFVENILNSIDKNVLIIIGTILFIIFLIDNICSFVIIGKMRIVVNKVRSDISDEIGKRVKEIVFNQSIFSRRLLIAYPDIKLPDIKIKRLHKKHFINHKKASK